MKFEDLKYDFPKMPEAIKNMIEKEVERQIKTEQMPLKGRTAKENRKGRKAVGRTAVASLIAVILCGTTVFAGVGLYRIQQKKIGEHGVSVGVAGGGHTAENVPEESYTIPDVKLETGYLPEGMVEVEQGKYCFEDALYQGGVSMSFYRMDTGDDKFEVQHGDVLSSETFTANGNEGVYLEYPNLYEEEITFNQRIYVAFTDVHYVMEMYAASDVSKEEAIKIAEHVKLIPANDAESEKTVNAWDWSSYQAGSDQFEEGGVCETATSIDIKEMNVHEIGDSFPVNDQGLVAKVSDVKVLDDIGLLDASLVDEDLRNESDGNGKLRPATIQYVKGGNMDSLSQEVDSREAPQKMVYVTVEYTNTGSEEMTDVLFVGTMERIVEADGKMQMITEEKSGDNDTWESAVNHGLSRFREMFYYDVHGGERGNNYIGSIMPGETATVHMLWVVLEEELGKLYLNLDTYGGGEFSESSLKIGYVDIRQ